MSEPSPIEPSRRDTSRGEPSWIDTADRLLAAPSGDVAIAGDDDAIDRHIELGLQLDGPTLFGSVGPSRVDADALQRVIGALTARRAAITVELADLARRRVELARSQRGAAGYASNGHIA